MELNLEEYYVTKGGNHEEKISIFIIKNVKNSNYLGGSANPIMSRSVDLKNPSLGPRILCLRSSCPRRFDLLYKEFDYIKWVKTSWKYSKTGFKKKVLNIMTFVSPFLVTGSVFAFTFSMR